MYQVSLSYFANIFDGCLTSPHLPESTTVQERTLALVNEITFVIYKVAIYGMAT